MFNNAMIFTLAIPPDMAGWTADELQDLLEPHQFTPGSSQEVITMGWVPPVEGGTLAHMVGHHILISLRTSRKLLPSSVVNKAAKDKAAEIEAQQGFKPGRKQMREIKEAVAETMLPKAFTVERDMLVWIDTSRGTLVIDTPSATRADEVLQMLNRAIEKMPLGNLHLEVSPATAMTEWLARDEAPANFTIDQDTELRSSGEGRATVRFIRQSVEADDARRHIEAGKQVTRLSMTWADRISFVLTESMTLKRIVPLDVIKEGAAPDEGFDGRFMLIAGELAKMFADLIDALGGHKAD